MGRMSIWMIRRKKPRPKNLANTSMLTKKTIRRDADFARGLEKLSPAIRKEILAGKVKVEKSKIQKIGKAKDLNEPISTLDEIEEVYRNLSLEVNDTTASKAGIKNYKLIQERYLKLTETLNKAYESKSTKEINALKTAFNKFLEVIS